MRTGNQNKSKSDDLWTKGAPWPNSVNTKAQSPLKKKQRKPSKKKERNPSEKTQNNFEKTQNPLEKTQKSHELLLHDCKECCKIVCHICLKIPETTFLLNCGHTGFCDICSMAILNGDKPRCPICDKNVAWRIRAYLDTFKYQKSSCDRSQDAITID